jgi:hypothetical protein
MLWDLLTLHFVFVGFLWFSVYTEITSLFILNQLLFLMEEFYVFSKIRNEFLSIIWTNTGFKELMQVFSNCIVSYFAYLSHWRLY